MSDFFAASEPHIAFPVLWQLCAQYTAQTKSDALTSRFVFLKIVKLDRRKRLVYIFAFNFTPRLYLAFHAISNGSLNDFDGTPWSL